MNIPNTPIGKKLPKNFMTPWVLLVLKQWNIHGYLIMQHLNQMGFPEIDHATLYKELRRLESEGCIESEWQTDGNGPAKRVYKITEAGEALLLGWTDVVSGYQRMINGFFDMYAQVFGFKPPAEPAPGSPGNQTKTNDSETIGGSNHGSHS